MLLGIAVLVALLAFREYLDIASRAGVHVSRPAGATAVALACVAVGMPGLPVEAVIAGTTLGLSALALGNATKATAGNETGYALHTAAISAFAPLYIGVPMGLLSATRWTLGREAALLLIITVAISDSFQYYFGRTFGRHLLAPVVSPKKTIEGERGIGPDSILEQIAIDPVVAQGKARIRVQLSAAHEQHHLDKAIAAFTKVGKELGVI